MFAATANRSVARICVLLGGPGQSLPPTVQSRPVAALLRPQPSRSGMAGDVSDLRCARS